MAIALGTIGSGRNSTGADITVALTIAGDNRYLIAVTTAQDSNHANMPVVSIKWNGTSLTKVRSDEPVGNVRTEIWYLVAPEAGSFNLVADYTGSLGEATLGGISLTGVSQVAPEGASGATGTNSTPSTSLTTTADNAWSVTVASAETTFSSINDSQTVLTGYPKADQSFENADAGYRGPISPAAATTLSYTIASGQVWAISAVSVAPETGTSTSTSTTTSTSSSSSTSITQSFTTSTSTSSSSSTSTTSTSTTSTSSSTTVSFTTSTSSSTSITTSTTITRSQYFEIDVGK